MTDKQNQNSSEKKEYLIGEVYRASNPKAGKNRLSCGVLKGWTEDGLAQLKHPRWGIFTATREDLDAHN